MLSDNDISNELVIYVGSNLEAPVHIAFDGETMWLTQDQIAAMFATTQQNVSSHISNIYADGELEVESTHKKILLVVDKGRNYQISHYNLDVVISVGYRVSSTLATKFRQWATQVIKERLTAVDTATIAIDEQRIMISDRISVENNDLVRSAADIGVSDITVFLNSGYQGMYGMKMDEIKAKKELGEHKLLDRANISELAANEFRITQTTEALKRLSDEDKLLMGQTAALTTHFHVGREVREAIERIGGVMPEEIPLAPDHISDVRKRLSARKTVPKLTD